MVNNKVLIIQHDAIRNLGITPSQCVKWVEESFSIKHRATLPPKSSIHPQGDDFFNTMPALLPTEYGRFGMKEVHRIEGQVPALGSDLLLYDSTTGRLLALMDADWITAMRTGAVAALSYKMFARNGANNIGFMGLGNTARATALCILDDNRNRKFTFTLLSYKNQADDFINRLSEYDNVSFDIVDTAEQMLDKVQVLVSCITSASGLICDDDNKYAPGMLLIPVHTRGFQNCDLFFDKVYGDDTGHICGFKYFSQFKHFDELSNVLRGIAPGRENDNERIICYNIGLGLHDALFASKIYDMITSGGVEVESFNQKKETQKAWI